ncbi:hypothetical protein F4212_06740 [Candidatus Poribacteria bacterium]|nr:hypothetical protein [Candidatus Poribacteria bacterium]
MLAPVALTKHVKAFPDSTQKVRAAHFGVSQRCICYGLKKLGYMRKIVHLQRTMSHKTGGISN